VHLLWALLGTALTAAGAMALNELAERQRDARMERTRHRPLPAGEISARTALVFGVASAAAGIVVLAVTVNRLTAVLGLAVVLLYTLVYTPLKTRSSACTLVGAVCGAIPPMMGWAAASGTLAFGAWLLAAIMFLWQIPHFLALAWLYREDYARGGFRVLAVSDPSGGATVLMANLYIAALLPVGAAAALAGVSGWISAAGAALLGGTLLTLGVRLARARSEQNARRLFLATLAYLPLVLALLVADRPGLRAPSASVSAALGQRAELVTSHAAPAILPR
jgi:protoheme IX farnesyltransferase